ncbi:MAG: hypothetical protein V4459_13885 [Pseudomonadota bacterium]
MKDDFLTRDWADNHYLMSDGVDKLVQRIATSIAEAFEELHDVQFDAPWRRQPRPPVCVPGRR